MHYIMKVIKRSVVTHGDVVGNKDAASESAADSTAEIENDHLQPASPPLQVVLNRPLKELRNDQSQHAETKTLQ